MSLLFKETYRYGDGRQQTSVARFFRVYTFSIAYSYRMYNASAV